MGEYSDGLKNVSNFDGSDGWFAFWRFALPTFVICFPVTVFLGLLFIPFAAFLGALFYPAASDALESLDTGTTAIVINRTIAAVLIVGLLAASVTRRLRDVGFSARWGLLPVVPYVIGTLAAHPIRTNVEGGLALVNAVTLLLLLVLMTLLLLPGRERQP